MRPAPPAGSITIAGKTVSRLGFGTMRLTSPGTWGDPDDRDTVDAYGPHTVEHLIREALYPYPEHVLIATKVGMVRPAPGQWKPLGNPFYLRACVEASLRRLDQPVAARPRHRSPSPHGRDVTAVQSSTA